MLKLYSARQKLITQPLLEDESLLKITTDPNLLPTIRQRRALLVKPDADVDMPNMDGFGAYLYRFDPASSPRRSGCIRLSPHLDYLAEGDVIRFNPKTTAIRCLWRRAANANSFLLTERCNSFCLMCSQPPRNVDDSHLIPEVIDAISMIDDDAKEIGLTGGEPTLHGDSFVDLLHSLKLTLPNTAVHVLTNGRNFKGLKLAADVARVNHHDLMFGIPLYSDISSIHDFVVQADGAYDETIDGILNLKRCGQRVEIRVVLHKQTIPRLVKLCEFIARNLTFVDHVALMGLEITGFARANFDELFIDPVEYGDDLLRGVSVLSSAGIRTSIYNLQLCILPETLWDYAVKSISDWKSDFNEECTNCDVQSRCGGIFSTSAEKPSAHIKAIQLEC